MKSTIRKPGVEAGIMNTPEYGPALPVKQFKSIKKIFKICVAPLASVFYPVSSVLSYNKESNNSKLYFICCGGVVKK
jgi:hypothetical protein